ncbi:hypothetical protein Tco_0672236 [Tanacetum coccineum]
MEQERHAQDKDKEQQNQREKEGTQGKNPPRTTPLEPRETTQERKTRTERRRRGRREEENNLKTYLGSTSGIRACALRNFDLEDMKFQTAQNNTTAKLPIVKLGEYEMWEMRIKQYFQVQDYALWEVIENGNSWVSVPQTTQENGTTVTKNSVPVTAEEKICKKNDVKARSLLVTPPKFVS